MAKQYGAKVPEKEAENIKNAWRNAHPQTTKFWRELEPCAIMAVKNPGDVFFPRNPFVGRPPVHYKKMGSFLFAKLPSGRCLSYPYPIVELITTPWGEQREALTYMGLTNNQWVKQKAYGGLLAENVTQAVARDLLAEAIKRCENRSYPVVGHVHDEIITEMREDQGSVEELERIMCVAPVWAKGLPIVAEGWRGK